MASITARQDKGVVNPPAVQSASGTGSQSHRKPGGYGLPCAKCKTYYPADLTVCPVCNSSDRVPATTAQPRVQISTTEQVPDLAVLEQERERFLREFNAQLPVQMAEGASAGPHCIKHAGDGTICQGCYDELQERVDVLEAALQMDLKEAAQIVYDAVWAEPSDPNLTYKNAAHALLSELRKRSGLFIRFTLFSEHALAD